jgi:DNA-binding MarR family transcriptional regulator
VDEPTDQRISFEARRADRILREALKVLIVMHPRMSLPQAMTFIRVAWEEGLTISELAKRCGVQPNTISKHLRDLGPIDRRQKPSLGLITVVQGVHDGRRLRHVVLTERGAAVARKMTAIVKRG